MVQRAREPIPKRALIWGLIAVLLPCIGVISATTPRLDQGMIRPGLPWMQTVWFIVASLPGILCLAYSCRHSRRGTKIAGWWMFLSGVLLLIASIDYATSPSPDNPAIQAVAAAGGWLFLFGLAFLILGQHIQPLVPQSTLQPQPLSRPSTPAPVVSGTNITQGFFVRIGVFAACAALSAAIASLPAIPANSKAIVLLSLVVLGLVAAGLVPSSVISDLAKMWAPKGGS